MSDLPPVTVGIPTYNRPDGLRRTLNSITKQSFSNIKITISDNCSTDPEVQKVIDEFCTNDSRIKSFRQKVNRGAGYNFQYLLKNADTKFFMWAADDDEWSSDFIEKCLLNIGDSDSVMCDLTIVNRVTGIRTEVTLPNLSKNNSKFKNASLFLNRMVPSMFYGIHRRESIQFFINDKFWDWHDCLFVLKQILAGGFATFSDNLFVAGVDDACYIPKPIEKRKGRLFKYRTFFIEVTAVIFRCKALSLKEKLALILVLAQTVTSNFVFLEKRMRPRTVILVSYINRVLNRIRT